MLKESNNRPSHKEKNRWSKSSSLVEKCSLLVGLGNCNLVDEQTNSTFRYDIRCTIANLDAHHSAGCGDSEHWEEVHDWICGPTHDSSHLSSLNLGTHIGIRLALSGCC